MNHQKENKFKKALLGEKNDIRNYASNLWLPAEYSALCQVLKRNKYKLNIFPILIALRFSGGDITVLPWWLRR